MKKKDFNYFKNLKYSVILTKVKNKYVLFIPELSLIVEDTSLLEAYKKLEKEKEKYFKNIILLKAEETVKEPTPLLIRKKIFIDLFTFFIKTLIVIFIIALVLLISLPYISKRIKNLPNKSADLIVEFSEKLNNMPEENKQKIQKSIKDMVKELKPYSDEVRVLWRDDEVDIELKQ